MIIGKILNNNAIVTYDEDGNEVIVMGRGIAFKKKIGENVEDDQIDKKFKWINPKASHKFQQLIVEIPIESIELVEEVVSYAKLTLGKTFDDMIYIQLVDHIHTSIVRFNEGIEVKNSLLWDIRRFYPDEFAIGMKALEMVKVRYKISLPEDEAGFIALHFANAEVDGDNVKNVNEITKVIKEISTIVRYHFNIEFDEDSVHYYRFITHLKFFSQRLINHKTSADEWDDNLFNIIKIKYSSAFECVLKIEKYIKSKYHYELSNEEKLYMTIHIERVVYKSKD